MSTIKVHKVRFFFCSIYALSIFPKNVRFFFLFFMLCSTVFKFLFLFSFSFLSYFCLARKLIWPLGSTHIFTQWGWHILFSPVHFFRASPNWGKSAKHSLPQKLSNWTGVLTVHSSLAEASRHHEESHLIYGPLESILIDQGFSVEYELDEFNTPHTGTILSRLQL